MEKEIKTIHYSRNGYEGNYLYKSVCGREVKTHQENESSSIHCESTTCEECMKTDAFKVDLFDLTNLDLSVRRRIYIESDILQASEFRHAKSVVFDFLPDDIERVFSDVLDFAWHDLDKTWEAVKRADEIWTTTSLLPLIGGSYTGAPVIFNGMCERAIAENITGKKIYILNQLDNIDWYMIDGDVAKSAFKENKLFAFNDDYDLVEVDLNNIEFGE